MDFISARETAEKWGITQRRVEVLCMNGQVRGVERVGNMWLIPKTASKPIDGRTKAAKQQKKPIVYVLPLDEERIIGMVNGTMAIENMSLTDDDRNRLRAVLRGESTTDETVRHLVKKHRRNTDAKPSRI